MIRGKLLFNYQNVYISMQQFTKNMCLQQIQYLKWRIPRTYMQKQLLT